MSEWLATSIGHKWQTVVRAWEPGDGLRCAFTSRCKEPCDIPVALVREEYIGPTSGVGSKSFNQPSTITRTVCLRHLAAEFTPDIGGTKAEREIEQNCAEIVIRNHWDEYQDEMVSYRRRLFEDRVAGLPKDLRERVLERLASGGGDAA